MHLLDCPDELIVLILLADTKLVRHWRQVNKRLHAISHDLWLWLGAFKQFRAERPLWKRPLELPLRAYDAKHLELVIERSNRLSDNAKKAELGPARRIELPCKGGQPTEGAASATGGFLIPGGRWLIYVAQATACAIHVKDLLKDTEGDRILFKDEGSRLLALSRGLFRNDARDGSASYNFATLIQEHDDDPTMAFIVLWEAAITGDTYEQSKLTMKELHRFSIPISVVHSFIILGDLLLLKPIWTDAMLAYKWRGDEEDVGTWRTFRTMFSYKVENVRSLPENKLLFVGDNTASCIEMPALPYRGLVTEASLGNAKPLNAIWIARPSDRVSWSIIHASSLIEQTNGTEFSVSALYRCIDGYRYATFVVPLKLSRAKVLVSAPGTSSEVAGEAIVGSYYSATFDPQSSQLRLFTHPPPEEKPDISGLEPSPVLEPGASVLVGSGVERMLAFDELSGRVVLETSDKRLIALDLA